MPDANLYRALARLAAEQRDAPAILALGRDAICCGELVRRIEADVAAGDVARSLEIPTLSLPSLARIRDRVDVALETVFNHFAGKREIVRALAGRPGRLLNGIHRGLGLGCPGRYGPSGIRESRARAPGPSARGEIAPTACIG
jgi:hypothetical protein